MQMNQSFVLISVSNFDNHCRQTPIHWSPTIINTKLVHQTFHFSISKDPTLSSLG